MLVVILALLPAAIATAIALGQILFYLLIGLVIIGGLIFLIMHPDILLGILGGALALAAPIASVYAVMWVAAQAEKRWPCILQRIGYGSGATFCATIALVTPFSASRPNDDGTGKLIVFIFFGLIAVVLGWCTLKAKPADTSKWFKT